MIEAGIEPKERAAGGGAPQAGGGRPDARGEARAAAQDRRGAQDAGRRRQQSRLRPGPGDDRVRRQQGRSRRPLSGRRDGHPRAPTMRSCAGSRPSTQMYPRTDAEVGKLRRPAQDLARRRTRGAAGPRPLPRCRLRPSERDLRQRRDIADMLESVLEGGAAASCGTC